MGAVVEIWFESLIPFLLKDSHIVHSAVSEKKQEHVYEQTRSPTNKGLTKDCEQLLETKLSFVQIVELSCMHVSFYRTGSKPYLVSSHQTVILRKLFSLSPEVYGWERFRVLHSDVYLYSKTGNIFVIYIYRCQYITNIFNCFRIKQKTI